MVSIKRSDFFHDILNALFGPPATAQEYSYQLDGPYIVVTPSLSGCLVQSN